MNITVLSGRIREFDVSMALLSDGIVVLDTMRPEATRIYTQMIEALDIDIDSEKGPVLHHLSIQAGDGGWTPYLVYSGVMASESPQVWNRLVESAVNQWDAEGSPSKFVAKVVNA